MANFWDDTDINFNTIDNTEKEYQSFEQDIWKPIDNFSDDYSIASDVFSVYEGELSIQSQANYYQVPVDWLMSIPSPTTSVSSVDSTMLHSPFIPPFSLSDTEERNSSNFVSDFVMNQNYYQPIYPNVSNLQPLLPFDPLLMQDQSINVSLFNGDQLLSPSGHLQVSDSETKQPKKKQVENRQKLESISDELEVQRGSNILPDGKFWTKMKSNGKVVYTCPRCDKGNVIIYTGFTRPFNLKSHYKGHLNILEYSCKNCEPENWFRRKADLNRHLDTVHGQIYN